MSVQQIIEQRLSEALELVHLEIVNESGNHNVAPGSETHFRVTLVGEIFEGVRLIQRHRMVNDLLKEQLAGPIHALAVHTYTRSEWDLRTECAPVSPPCLGGSAGEKSQ